MTYIPLDSSQVISKTETFSYQSRTSETALAPPVSVANCKRRAADGEDFATTPALLGKVGLVIHVWAINLPAGVVPKLRDVLTDAAGVPWLVLKVETQTWQSRYRLTCCKAS